METTERPPSEADLMMQAYEALKRLPRDAQDPAIKWLAERLMISRLESNRFLIAGMMGNQRVAGALGNMMLGNAGGGWMQK